MSLYRTVTVTGDETGLRLDRWIRKRYPLAVYAEIQKLLRTGQIRVDGGRAKPNFRLESGMEIRIPPQLRDLDTVERAPNSRPPAAPSEKEAEALRRRILYRDDDVIAIDKPAGLAVQGGTGTRRHLDGMLDALRFGAAERPRLVHRLDKDTSGVMVLARTREAAQALTAAFRARETRKLYLAISCGVPHPHRGRISMALVKGARGAGGRERMLPESEDAREDSRPAITLYDVLDFAADRAALVALMPLTGRTHQLRAHLAAIGTPILGDGKYGAKAAFLDGPGIGRQLHLHARSLEIAGPSGARLKLTAPLPPHIVAAMNAFGFVLENAEDRFPQAAD